MLWRILDEIFDLGLVYDQSELAVRQRKEFLKRRKIGICDIVESGLRERMNASDLGLKEVQLRDLIGYLRQFESVDTLLFTGGNSRNGPEYFFRKQLREQGGQMRRVNSDSPRIHEFELPGQGRSGDPRIIRTVSLIAPTGTANIAIGSSRSYKEEKQRNPDFTTFDFRIRQYRKFF